MKHFKITSAMLSAVMCVSMLAAPVSVMAEETPATSETQTEATEKQETAETQKPAPKETDKKEPEVSEKKEPDATEPEVTETHEPSETEKKVVEPLEETKPSETEEQLPEVVEENVTEAAAKKKAASKIIDQGNVDKIKWELDDKGVLTISGSGNITDDVAVALSSRDNVKTIVFSGDLLFAESIGRSDFYDGNSDELINSIKTKILTLPDDTEVYPGHMEKTTVGHERVYNPYF